MKGLGGVWPTEQRKSGFWERPGVSLPLVWGHLVIRSKRRPLLDTLTGS